MKRYALSLAFAIVVAPSLCAAQVPPEIAAELRAIGRVVSAGPTSALFLPLHDLTIPDGIAVERDVVYGPHELNKMDIFTTGTDGATRPVLIFAHGGGFARGDKHREGAAHYDNLMIWAAQQGMVGVNINDRLAPDDPWPAAQDDLVSVINWTKQNIARYGGDPNKIMLGGQSAGAGLIANHLAHAQLHGPDGHGVIAAYLSSGQYEITGPSAYYGDDPALWAERSSFPHLANLTIPMFLTRAELDPPGIAEQGDKLNQALCAAGNCPTFIVSKDHNHNSQIYAIRTGDETITKPLSQFLQEHVM